MMPKMKPIQAHFQGFDTAEVIPIIRDYETASKNIFSSAKNREDYPDDNLRRTVASYEAAQRLAEKYNCRVDVTNFDKVIFIKS